jgi:hypothetical protein
MALSPCFLLPLADFLLPPFLFLLLTWNPPCCNRIRPSWSQVARELISPFPSLPIPSPFQNPDPLGLSRAKCAPTKTTSQHWLASPAHLYYSLSTSFFPSSFSQLSLSLVPSPNFHTSLRHFFP